MSLVPETPALPRMPNHEVASLFRSHAVLNCAPVTLEARVSDCGGQHGGYFACSPAFPGRVVHLKPRFKTTYPVAAREKIASDLAHDLNVPVAPVVLSIIQEPPPLAPARCREVALSLRMFRQAEPWSLVRGRITGRIGARGFGMGDRARRAAVIDAARAFVFDVWVGQYDHTNNHTSNFIYGFDESTGPDGAFSFFDYEMALGAFNWPPIDPPIRFPPELLALVSREEVTNTVDRITQFPANSIRTIVGRIPEQFLHREEGERIVSGLMERRPQLRAAVDSQLSGVVR